MFNDISIKVIKENDLLDDDRFYTFYHYILDTVFVRLSDIGISEWYVGIIKYDGFYKAIIHINDESIDGVMISGNSTSKELPTLKEFYSIKIELLELLTDLGYEYDINQNILLSFMFDVIK